MKWRYNQDGRNVCIMNDYSVNGHLMPNSFAHISSEFTDGDTPVIRCSCQIYNFIQNVEIEEGSEIAPEDIVHALPFFSRNICSMPTKLLIKDVQKSHDHWKLSDLQFSS